MTIINTSIMIIIKKVIILIPIEIAVHGETSVLDFHVNCTRRTRQRSEYTQHWPRLVDRGDYMKRRKALLWINTEFRCGWGWWCLPRWFPAWWATSRRLRGKNNLSGTLVLCFSEENLFKKSHTALKKKTQIIPSINDPRVFLSQTSPWMDWHVSSTVNQADIISWIMISWYHVWNQVSF